MSDNAVVVCTWGEERDGLPAGAEEVLTIGRGLADALGNHGVVIGCEAVIKPETVVKDSRPDHSSSGPSGLGKDRRQRRQGRVEGFGAVGPNTVRGRIAPGEDRGMRG